MKSTKNLSDLLRKLRKATGVTQEQFAAKLGVTFFTVNRWEDQKTVLLSLALEKLEQFRHELTQISIKIRLITLGKDSINEVV